MKNMKIKLEEQDDMTTDSGKEYLHLITGTKELNNM